MNASPVSDPVWRALAAEAGIAADQIGEGATLLAKCVPEYPWTFSRAFFPLSIGLERACKIALHVDARLVSGAFLTSKQMRAYGHGLTTLISEVESIGQRVKVGNSPNDEMHQNIVSILDGFATGGRYHYLDDLGGNSVAGADPGERWWNEVVLAAGRLHYKASRRERDEAQARELGEAMDQYSLVRHVHVAGRATESVGALIQGQALMDATTPWVRMYALQIARWLGAVLRELSLRAHQVAAPEIPELWEFFSKFDVDDRFLRERKTWRPMA